MSARDGGPAFPANHFDMADGEHGMTLRDYFAGQAISGFLRAPLDGFISEHDVAHEAYKLADAMLAERAKEQPK